LKHPDIAVNSLVVSESNGWRFVEKNSTIKVVIAVQPEIAERPPRREGLVTIIPYAIGDTAGHYKGLATEYVEKDNLILERPEIYEFKKALITIGVEENEATRLAASTGRSWSVFRRHCALNPAIRKPKWLNTPQARALSTLCLLGGWSGGKITDRTIVANLSGCLYEDIERDLRFLSYEDDSPVLEIGEVWKAKSPLELFNLFSDQITSDELGRYFSLLGQILVEPDPILELPEENRFAAAIYGKVKPQSELLIKSACDTLIKLAVRGKGKSKETGNSNGGRPSDTTRDSAGTDSDIREAIFGQ
jgi:hypothetical protein